MQALITIPVVDSLSHFAQTAEMLTHDELRAEFLRQIEDRTIKQSDVAKALGIPAPRVAEIKKGLRRIQPNEMPLLAKLLGLSTSGQVIASNDIPLWGKVAAGVWLEQSYVEEDSLEYVPYDRTPGDADDTGLFAVELAGDSMDARFPSPRTRLICRQVQFGFAEVVPGKYYIIERENHELREMTCKRLEIDENGDFLLVAESHNPKYAEPIRVPRSKEDEHVDNGIRILGRVIRAVDNLE